MSKLPPLPALGVNKLPFSTKKNDDVPVPKVASSLPPLTALPPLSQKPASISALPPLVKSPSKLSALPPIVKSPVKVEPVKVEPVKVEPVKVSALPPILKSPVATSTTSIKPLSSTAQTFVPQKDPRQHIETFFGLRNGIQPFPIEGKNYTLETLTYMTSFNRANQMTQIIVDEMKSLGHNTFDVYEAGAGIGGNTLSFADSPNINKVFAYEILPERREMLRRNVEMYKFGNKVEVLDDPFTTASCGNVLFIDAPWLTGKEEASKQNYILQGMSLGGKTLEEWIVGCEQCALVAFKVPPGYKLQKKF